MSNFPWRTALFVSLALNLVAVSAVVGAFASGARLERPGHHGGGLARQMRPRAFMDALPVETRRALRRDLAGDLAAISAQRTEVRDARLELYRVASADAYDADRVSGAFARVRAADAALQEPLHNALAQRLATLPADQRRAAIEAMTEGPRMMRRGDRRGGRGDGRRGEGMAPPFAPLPSPPPEAP